MTTLTERPTRRSEIMDSLYRYIPISATLFLLLVMYVGGVSNYRNFDRPQVVLNLFIDNAALLIVAVGMTFVIITGGIDLSVGSMMAFSTMCCAWLTVEHGVPATVAVPAVVLFGIASGAFTGAIIHYFDVQPFIATLAGLFLYRGLTLQISTSDIAMRDIEFFAWGKQWVEFTPDARLRYLSFVAFAVVIAAFVVLHYTRFGRSVYAIGGSESSALLMGLRTARTKVGVYAISGGCAALAGVVAAWRSQSATPLAGLGMELEAIAAVVIGGTLLTGGAGFVLGTVAGVLVLGLIRTIISFQGSLSSWWAQVVIGALLLAFILLQRLLARLGERRRR
jgi:simple sugar transport system permease protein